MPSLLVNLILFLIICFFVNCLQIPQCNKTRILLVVAACQVIFFQTFKDVNSLPDILGYVDAYRYICRDDATYLNATVYYKMQYGYYLYNKLLSIISNNPYYFTFVTGCVISLPYIFFIKKYSPIVWYSLTLYLMSFLQSTFVLRQYTAVSICIISLFLLFKQRFVWCGILLLVAISIHPTAIFFCITYVLYFIHGKKLLLVFYVSLFFVLYVCLPIMMQMFVDNVGGYDVYLENETFEYSTFLIYLFIGGMGYIFLVFKKKEISEETVLMMKMLGVAVVVPLAATFSNASTVVPRLLLYVTFVQFVIIAKTLISIKVGLVRFVAYALYAFIFFYQFYISDNSRIFEFKLIFE